MSTLRRLYTYAMTLFSLEMALWGLDWLIIKTAHHPSKEEIALPLAALLAGGVVFWLHWSWAQREAHLSTEENTAPLRVAAVYLALLLTWGAAFHAGFGLLGKVIGLAFHYRRVHIFFADSSWTALISGLLLNSAVGLYFERVRQSIPLDEIGIQIRLVYRYTWLSYAFLWLILGSTTLLRMLADFGRGATGAGSALARGVMLALGGLFVLVVWGRRWWNETLKSKNEHPEIVAFFYLTWALLGLSIGLNALGVGVCGVLDYILGSHVPSALNSALRQTVSVGVPWLAFWLFAQYGLRRFLESRDDEFRSSVYRLELSILSAIGLVVLTIGISALITQLVANLWGLGSSLGRFASGITLVLIGLPLWGIPWQAMRREMLADRLSFRHTTYRIYLYAVIFAAALGVMIYSTVVLYRLLLLVLAVPSWKIVPFAYALGMVVWTAGVLALHVNWLTEFRRAEAESLKVEFPVLVLAGDAAWAKPLSEEEGLNLHFASLEEAPPQGIAFRAVVVDGGILPRLSPAWAGWLDKFDGARLVVPAPSTGGWLWFNVASETPTTQAHRIRDALKALALGRKPRLHTFTLWWRILAYVGVIALLLFLLQAVFTIVAALVYSVGVGI